eukprot:4694525-Pleurochrysis_carterae.AAC.1
MAPPLPASPPPGFPPLSEECLAMLRLNNTKWEGDDVFCLSEMRDEDLNACQSHYYSNVEGTAGTFCKYDRERRECRNERDSENNVVRHMCPSWVFSMRYESPSPPPFSASTLCEGIVKEDFMLLSPNEECETGWNHDDRRPLRHDDILLCSKSLMTHEEGSTSVKVNVTQCRYDMQGKKCKASTLMNSKNVECYIHATTFLHSTNDECRMLEDMKILNVQQKTCDGITQEVA